jgi:hypothetical protein
LLNKGFGRFISVACVVSNELQRRRRGVVFMVFSNADLRYLGTGRGFP